MLVLVNSNFIVEWFLLKLSKNLISSDSVPFHKKNMSPINRQKNVEKVFMVVVNV